MSTTCLKMRFLSLPLLAVALLVSFSAVGAEEETVPQEELGACCWGEFCSNVTYDYCMNYVSGTWLGAGTRCDDCGSCCFMYPFERLFDCPRCTDGCGLACECIINGYWFYDHYECMESCEEPFGACCRPAGDPWCLETTYCDCDSDSGRNVFFHGGRCGPGTCATPAELSTWGRIKALYR